MVAWRGGVGCSLRDHANVGRHHMIRAIGWICLGLWVWKATQFIIAAVKLDTAVPTALSVNLTLPVLCTIAWVGWYFVRLVRSEFVLSQSRR